MKKLLLTLAVAGFIGSSLSAMADEDRGDHNWNDHTGIISTTVIGTVNGVIGTPTITIMNSSGWAR
jgi:hypothetical protein